MISIYLLPDYVSFTLLCYAGVIMINVRMTQ